MVKEKKDRYVNSRFKSVFQHCHEISEHEVGRPKLRMLRKNPIVAGQLEYLVQPIYDFYGVAVATAVTKQQLFAQPIGASYTPSGGAAFVKTLYHTNLVQPGMLDAPKKMLVKAVAGVLRSDTAIQDANSFIGLTLTQLTISGKDYWTALFSKCPAGAGTFATFGNTQTLAAGGTSVVATANGWPSAQNVATITDPMPQIPGLDPMEPILGQLIEQNQNFGVVLDPTISGAAAFTTLAAAPATQFIGVGINAHVSIGHHIAERRCCKSLLIELNPAMGTMRNSSNGDRKRLSEETPFWGDAIVRPAANRKLQKLAEMTNSRTERSNKQTWKACWLAPSCNTHNSSLAA
jgi:hypothetical protein